MGLDLTDPYWKMFAIVIQLGAIFSVIVYFRKRLADCGRSFALAPSFYHPISLTLLAFLITAVPAFLLAKLIGKNLESLPLIGASLVIGGVAMWVIDRVCDRPTVFRIEDMKRRHAVWIGAFQILAAVFPGVSRSMGTIAGAQLVGMSRASALELSFFISIPTMVAATGYDLLKTIAVPLDGALPLAMGPHQWLVLGTGFLVCFLVAWIVVAWFMSWVRRHGFVVFAVYRILFGLFVLGVAFANFAP
jgi:undecaprenyl-diphosphatase